MLPLKKITLVHEPVRCCPAILRIPPKINPELMKAVWTILIALGE